MKLRFLKVQNFRGIKELEWVVNGNMVCLIGPGDSTKTTILDAIDYALSPRWNLTFSDNDFYQSNVTQPINITATISGLPQKLIREDKFGLHLCFWQDKKGIHDEYEDGDEYALTISLNVDTNLEPIWSVISGQTGESIRISASDREQLGVSQIGNYIDRDLSWGKGSALYKLTGRDNIDEIPSILANASRVARLALQKADLGVLGQSVKQAEVAASHLGVNVKQGFRPGMDPLLTNVGLGTITLLDGEIPLKLAGTGSRRLLVMAIHRDCAKEGSILLVDEIEYGLEPYRLRNLIRSIRPKNVDTSQTIVTTHSSVAIVEFNANELYIVQSSDGKTSVTPVDESLQNVIRSIPEAFLARRIIVCEGKTEYGLCRALDGYWQSLGKEQLAYMGIEPICSPKSGGSEAPKYALKLAGLGYSIAYLGDSDKKIQPSQEELEEAKVKVFLWDGNLEIERRLTHDLPWESLPNFIDLAIQLSEKEHGTDSIWDAIKNKLGWQGGEFPRDLEKLREIKTESEIRESIGSAANSGEWFKRTNKGQMLGQFLTPLLEKMKGTDTELKLRLLKEWCYA